jgi:hypothetical protein
MAGVAPFCFLLPLNRVVQLLLGAHSWYRSQSGRGHVFMLRMMGTFLSGDLDISQMSMRGMFKCKLEHTVVTCARYWEAGRYRDSCAIAKRTKSYLFPRAGMGARLVVIGQSIGWRDQDLFDNSSLTVE